VTGVERDAAIVFTGLFGDKVNDAASRLIDILGATAGLGNDNLINGIKWDDIQGISL